MNDMKYMLTECIFYNNLTNKYFKWKRCMHERNNLKYQRKQCKTMINFINEDAERYKTIYWTKFKQIKEYKKKFKSVYKCKM